MERERERERDIVQTASMYTHIQSLVHACVAVYVYGSPCSASLCSASAAATAITSSGNDLLEAVAAMTTIIKIIDQLHKIGTTVLHAYI